MIPVWGRHIVADVLILSSHALFRDGLGKLIGDVATVRSVSSLDEMVRLARSEAVQAVILDQSDADASTDNQTLARLLAIPGLKVITVTLNENVVRIFHREEVTTGAVQALRRTLTAERSPEA